MESSIQGTGVKDVSMTQFRKHNINHTIVQRRRFKCYTVPGREHSEALEWSGLAEICTTTETDKAETGQACILGLLLEYCTVNTGNQSSLNKVCMVTKI